ncbi:four helix bundle protein [Akkermansia muciniphila]|uniref:four helix bundle protein n=1 Tax=Akkermansia muciniphila TaxID=239935 RepID=UPI003D2F545A
MAHPAHTFRYGHCRQFIRSCLWKQQKGFLSQNPHILKECSETHTWLKLPHAAGSLTKKEVFFIDQDCTEILNMLISINKTAQPDSY